MVIMTIDEMRKHEWTISWSGGKDSTATIILCHENGIPIKEIIYVRMMYDDTMPATLPVMTDFVDRSKKVFEKWGYKVSIVESIKTAKSLSNMKYKRSKKLERNGKPYGVTNFGRGFCIFSGIKKKTINSIVKNEYELIGYASDEKQRLGRLTDTKQSIMLTLGVIEREAFSICKKYNLLSPLYDLGFTRDGCWFCPNAGKEARNFLRKYYPELVNEIIWMIEVCGYDVSTMSKRNNWVADYYNYRGNKKI